MALYLLKFSGCLLLFMLFYKLILEKESFHRFKRFYLLISLTLSLIIPFITFTNYIEVAPTITTTTELVDIPFQETTPVEITWKDYLPNILWGIYFIGLIVFSIRFSKHLFELYLKIKHNLKLKDQNITNVLVVDNINPHTFLKYIFLNRYKFENKLIPKEVLLHERTHAKQLHALDILLIELLQIIFWFNPLIYVLKKDIKLNHEFLADQSVLQTGTEAVNYQKILLAFSSNANEHQLANAINYASIKKRLTVMKTHTSKTKTWFKNLLILPLLAFIIYGFSTTKDVIKLQDHYTDATLNYTARNIAIEIIDNDTYRIDGIKANKASLVKVVTQMHQDITPDIRKQIMNIHLSSQGEISNEETWFIYNALLNYGFHRMVTPNQEIILSKGNTPFAINNEQINTAIELYLNTKGELFYNNKKINVEELASIQTLGDDMSISIETPLQIDIEITKKVSKSIREYLSDKGLNGFSICITNNNIDDFQEQEILVVEDLNLVIEKDNTMWLNDTEVTLDNLAQSINDKLNHLTISEVNTTRLLITNKTSISYLLLKKIHSEVKKTPLVNINYRTVLSNPQNPVEAVKEELKKANAYQIKHTQDRATDVELKEYNSLAKHYNTMLKKEHFTVYGKDIKRLKHIYNLMSNKQRESAEPFPDFPKPPPPLEAPKPENSKNKIIENNALYFPNGAKKEQLKEYNTLAKLYTKQLNSNSITVNKYQVDRLKFIYGIMTKQQKEAAEPFPNLASIPPPPPSPAPENSSPKQLKRNENLQQKYQKQFGATVKTKNVNYTNQEPPQVYFINGKPTSKSQVYTLNKNAIKTINVVKKGDSKEIHITTKENFGNDIYLKNGETNTALMMPPPPPEPVAPIEHIKQLAEKNALFFLENKKVSSNKAIKALENNKHLNVQIYGHDSKEPKVYISKKPITVKKQ